MAEDEVVGWYHGVDRHEFEQAPELVMDREAGLQSMGCCNPWGLKESDTTE